MRLTLMILFFASTFLLCRKMPIKTEQPINETSGVFELVEDCSAILEDGDILVGFYFGGPCQSAHLHLDATHWKHIPISGRFEILGDRGGSNTGPKRFTIDSTGKTIIR